MAVKGLVSEEFVKDFESLVGHALPNGVVVNGVLGWLFAADDKLERGTYVKIMMDSFMEEEVEQAKVILVELVQKKMNVEKIRNDKELAAWVKGRANPEKKRKQIDDIVNIFERLDAYDCIPEFLMSAAFVKRAPKLDDPDDNVESVSHKVKMLESVVVNLANKLSDETRILKEDSKAIRSEIKNLKPTFSDLFKNRENGFHPSGRTLSNNGRSEQNQPSGGNVVPSSDIERRPKRSRTGEGVHARPDVKHMEAADEVFDEGFQTQPRRGFLGTGNRQNVQGEGDDQRKKEQDRTRKPSWKKRLPNITGASNEMGFAAPIDLFVFNVNKDVTEEAIKNHMKDAKELDIIECVTVSHQDARTKSFCVKVKAEDYDKAMSGETWPYRVRVRPYKHFRQRREEGGQFNAGGGAAGQDADRRHGQNQH